MGGVINVRLPNDLWYTEVTWDNMLKWEIFEVSYIDNEVCFVNINGTKMELKRSDYDKLKKMKPLNFKFNVKKLKL
jgi:hypothetical protein